MSSANLIPIILPPLIGAGIGYFTNWLAIKMLFRPYTKKSLSLPGFKSKIDLPFTPGLFPKEQAKLAAKVANTVTSKLLTPEDIRKITVKVVTPENIDHAVDVVVDSILKEFQNIRKLRDISEEISHLVSTFLRQSVPGIIEDSTKKSPLIKDLLQKTFDNLILKMYIPEDTAYSITDSIFKYIATPNTIRNWFIDILTNNNIENFNKLVQQNTKGGYFVLSRIVTAKSALENVRDFFKGDPESANETIQDTIDKLELKRKLAVALSKLSFQNMPYSTVEMLREYFIELFLQYILDNSKNMAEKFTTEEMTKILTDRILQFDTTKFNANTLTTIKKEIASFISRYLERELGNLVEQAIPHLGIENVITSKVANFSPKRIEEIIIDISKRELIGIQRIGGALGFLIGCINSGINILLN